jgi:hypothetical protein
MIVVVQTGIHSGSFFLLFISDISIEKKKSSEIIKLKIEQRLCGSKTGGLVLL